MNQLFGGSFSDGVGSNTWAHTPFQKYDYADPARKESLAEVSPEQHAKLVECMQLAQAFKGAKLGHLQVTEKQKIEAIKCMHIAKKKAEAKKLSIDTSLAEPKMERPNEVHIYKPPKSILERRAKIEKADKMRVEKLEKAKAKAREEAMHPHIIKAHHFFPKKHFGLKKKAAGVEGKILKEANKARKELSARLHKMPSFVTSQAFDDNQGARKRDTKDVSAKLAFWEVWTYMAAPGPRCAMLAVPALHWFRSSCRLTWEGRESEASKRTRPRRTAARRSTLSLINTRAPARPRRPRLSCSSTPPCSSRYLFVSCHSACGVGGDASDVRRAQLVA